MEREGTYTEDFGFTTFNDTIRNSDHGIKKPHCGGDGKDDSTPCQDAVVNKIF